MRAVRSKNTQPELILRRALRAAGLLGYRIHLASLPGTPDIAFTRWRVAIFVDGTFWHGDPRRWHPERASPYWREKVARNQERDARVDRELAELGWVVIRVWDTDLIQDNRAALQLITDALNAQRFGSSDPSGEVPRRRVPDK